MLLLPLVLEGQKEEVVCFPTAVVIIRHKLSSLKIAQIYYLIVLEVTSPKGVSLG